MYLLIPKREMDSMNIQFQHRIRRDVQPETINFIERIRTECINEKLDQFLGIYISYLLEFEPLSKKFADCILFILSKCKGIETTRKFVLHGS